MSSRKLNKLSSANAVPDIVHGYISVQKFKRNQPEQYKKRHKTTKLRRHKDLVQHVAVHILKMKTEVLKDIKIQDISKLFNVHPSLLSRKFKQEKEYTLCEFIQRVKIQRAVLLLQQDVIENNTVAKARQNGLKIDNLSTYLGFSSTEYFIRCFKKRIGVPPNTYRKCFKMQVSGNYADPI